MEWGRKGSFWDYHLPMEQRIDDLISRMTLREKISQMGNSSVEIKHLGIPAYQWANEALHGVMTKNSTVFPQSIGLAATWNTKLIYEVARAVSDEARAKYNKKENIVREKPLPHKCGLTYWSPTINIARDPRWGRVQETYGEDPYLTSRMGVVYVKGLQGDDSKYLKLVSCVKHFGAHNGPELTRFFFDSKVSKKDLEETYFPAFEACVKKAKAESVMTAYNRLNGVPCTANKYLVEDVVRKKWGFKGHIVSDCNAIFTMFFWHRYAKCKSCASVKALNAGCDLNCGNTYVSSLMKAVKSGKVSEQLIDKSLRRLLDVKFRLGMFDPPEHVPFSKIPNDIIECEKHRKLALKTARESLVLLKNKNNILPLDKKQLKTVAVIGPNAHDRDVLLGSYNGYPSEYVTPLQALMAKLPDVEILYDKGCNINLFGINLFTNFERAISIAEKSDIVFLVLGISQKVEAEGLDRRDITLPKAQQKLIKEIKKTEKPIVLIILSGSAVTVTQDVDAIIKVWYPGQEAGTAISDVIFGDYNPGGRLPLTIYKSIKQVGSIKDYNMEGKTYRFMEDEPLYPFGYGLSYSKFSYSNLNFNRNKIKPDEKITISVDVKNISKRAGDEVVQLYVKDVKASTRVPLKSLQGFERIHLKAGQKKKVKFALTPYQLSVVDEEGKRFVEPGEFKVFVGGMQPELKASENFEILSKKFRVIGKRTKVEFE